MTCEDRTDHRRPPSPSGSTDSEGIARSAPVHSYEKNPPVTTLTVNTSFGWAAGGLVSTPSELVRWVVALYGGELLSRKALTEMTTRSGETPPDQNDYGLATFIEAGDGHTLIGHTGGIGGSGTYAYFLEPEGVAVVMMANRMPVDFRKASQHVFRVLVKQ